MAKKLGKKVPKLGEILVMNYFVPGAPVGLSAGAVVEVVEKAPKGCERGRVRVKSSLGLLYWVSAESYHVSREHSVIGVAL